MYHWEFEIASVKFFSAQEIYLKTPAEMIY